VYWSRRFRITSFILVSAVSRLTAQQADVIRGRVTAQDGAAIDNARITVTSIPNNVTKTTTSDKSGRYAVTFPSGDGDYWIGVLAIGFAQRRFELKRLADEAILVGDVKLAPSGVTLDAVKVQADRARPNRNGGVPDISGTEKTIGSAAVDPSQAGNLAAMAASVPGVQLIPGADGNPDQFSVFGLSGDQNSTTLNGLGFSGSDIPRDATTRASLGTTPWDVSRGGFSGAQMGLSTQAGSNFSSRGFSTLLNTPAAQWTDRAGRSLGAQYTSASVGAATAGPVSMDKSFYSVGYQFDRRMSDLPTLAGADRTALRIAGVSPDSLVRFRNILSRVGAPVAASGLPSTKISDRGLLLANFDWAPPTSTTGQAVTVTAATSFVRLNAPFAQVTALPTNDLRTNNWLGAIQARQTMYLGVGILSETSGGVNQQRSSTTPYLEQPSAGVRVNSVLDDGSSAIAGLTFAGSPTQRTKSTNTTGALQNQLSWYSLDNKHRVQLTSTIRYENFSQDLTTNSLGNFLYNSLADLEAGRAALYTRTLSPRLREGNQVVAALALGDAFRATPNLQFQYGLRLDGNRFLRTPTENDVVRQAFGVSNDALPNRLYLSPRLGFSWTYGQAAQLAVGEGFARGPRAVVRGGIGVFQNTPNAQIIGAALSNTGLPSAVVQLACTGSAAPRADWEAYRLNPAAIPSQCTDGSSGSVFASNVPDVSLFDPRYAAQRSVRSNVNWSGAVLGNRFLAGIDATYSMNLNQPGATNLNFDPSIRFRIAAEGDRPVYARLSSIVTTTGSVATADARLNSTLGNVLEQRSDLSSVNRQLAVTLQPITFSSRFTWNLGYVYSNTRDLVRGFSSTDGDPRERAWGRSSLDSRHQVVYSISYNFFDWVPVGLSGSFRSGRPFTPQIASDINGDGFRNDRAFVFDPSAVATTDPTLSAGMRDLLSGGSAEARACLGAQVGRIATRGSCQEPWSSTSNMTIGFNPVKFRLPQRLNFSLYVNNALGAADLALHGESKRRGWGQAINPDATLLFVRGFDPIAQRFRYEVNPRFGSTNPNETVNRNPVVVTAQFRLDVGFTRERQLLTQSLDRGRRTPGARSTDQDIRGMSSTLIPQNPMTLIMREADSLKLTRKQADSISSLNRVYAVTYDSIWTPVAKYLAGLPEQYDRAAAYDRYRSAREETIGVLMKLVPVVRDLLTPDQIRRLPTTAATSLDRRYLAAVRSSTAGGANMGALGLLAQMGWTGGTIDPSATAVMIHR
jgi:hypothetical protein